MSSQEKNHSKENKTPLKMRKISPENKNGMHEEISLAQNIVSPFKYSTNREKKAE